MHRRRAVAGGAVVALGVAMFVNAGVSSATTSSHHHHGGSTTTTTTRPPVTTTTQAPVTTTTGAPSSGGGPSTKLHYTANGNFSSSGTYEPGADGFNLADVGSNDQATSLPAGVKGLAWVGLCGGATSAFKAVITPFIGDPKVFGFYLMDEPDPTGEWHPPACPASDLKAESDWVHANDPGAKTFIILMNMGATSDPTFAGTYDPANTDIDLFGLDPYPCRTELNGCDFKWVPLAVSAAEAEGVPLADIVPVYETFGGGTWTDDGGGKYLMPSASQLTELLSTWGSVVPTPIFDYAYSWGVQDSDVALSGSTADQTVMRDHNAV